MTPSRLGVASLILVAGLLGSRVLGVVRNVVLAQAFGAGPELDAYFAAFRVPDTLFQLLVGSVLGSAFLPTFTRIFTRDGEAAAWRLASAALTTFTGLGVLAALGGFLASPWLVPLTVPGFSPEQQRTTIALTQIMLLSTALFCTSGMITGVLNSRSHFLLPAIAPWLYNLSIIVATLLFTPVLGVAAPAWGVSAGALLHLVVQLPGLRAVGMRWAPAGPRTHGLGEVARLMGPRVFALGAAQFNWLAATLLASGLAAGSVTALNYGWALAMLPLGLFGMAPATAAFPVLAAAAARGDWEAYAGTLQGGLRVMLFLALPASAGLALVGQPLVALLFQRGEFDAGATLLTSTALAFFSFGLFAHVTLEITSRASYALADTRTPLAYALAGSAVNLALGLALREPLGVAGLALAMSLAAVLEAAGLLVVVAKRTPGWSWQSLAGSVQATCAATLAMALAVRLLQPVAAGLPLPLNLTVLTTAGGAVFVAVAAALRSAELATLTRSLLRGRAAG